MRLFAAGNVLTFGWLTLLTQVDPWSETTIRDLGSSAILRHIALVGSYVALIAFGYVLVRRFARSDGGASWIAFFYPLLLLIVFKYLYFLWQPIVKIANWEPWVLGAAIIGLSYMAFRLSYLVLEVRNETVEMPTLSEYLGFAFFLPTMLVGPINPFREHQSSIRAIEDREIPYGRCLMRVLVGLTKFLFLANLANQLTYSGIFLDGKPHLLIDLGIAAVFYYFFLYLNFSGFCDIAIGIAGLMGIKVRENFNNPFAARNVKEFWNRWHITLSEYTKDVIFTPLSKVLIGKLGVRHANSAIALSIFTVFLVIGIWHGVGWNFVLFGLVHAAGVVSNHLYTVFLKRRLGREGYKSYNNNRLVNAFALLITFAYVAFSFSVFANDRAMMGIIKNAIFS
ncbi:MAG: hypothetical protein KIS76_10465 [Pyrinomonadaceae bacterium]|nr:hypothetical protein [Pyrinomonadaceae bacterium]